jgi:3-oxoacyl-[acyl-carrier protein] reductase
MPEFVWYNIINTNLTGVFLMCKHLIPLMTDSSGGRIINISSIFANNPPSMRTAYAASKAGVIGLSKSLSKELAPKQICVNVINPGPVETEMLETIWHTTANKMGITFDEYKQNQLNKIPLAKLCKAADISCAVQFLLSDSSSHITGAALDINGGAV